jgi:hypothetical protein
VNFPIFNSLAVFISPRLPKSAYFAFPSNNRSYTAKKVHWKNFQNMLRNLEGLDANKNLYMKKGLLFLFVSSYTVNTAKNQYPKFETNIPRKGIAQPQSQFPHWFVFERFIYSHDQPAYSSAGNMWIVDLSWEYINRSQTHDCGNWNWGRATPEKEYRGIFVAVHAIFGPSKLFVFFSGVEEGAGRGCRRGSGPFLG